MQHGLELADVGDPDDGRAGRVRGGQVHLGADAPVVIAGRVVEDLPHRPPAGLLVDDQQGRAAGIGPGADLVVLREIRLDGLLPRTGARPGGTARCGPAPGTPASSRSPAAAARPAGRPAPAPGCAAAPTHRSGWSRSAGPAPPATRSGRSAPRSWPPPGPSGAAPCRRWPGSAAPALRRGTARRTRCTR